MLFDAHIKSAMPGGTSTATTVPGDDQAALENARRGTAQVRQLDAEMKASEEKDKEKPAVLRVNSIPVLTTPEQKIRKTHTPTEPLGGATGSPVAPDESSAAMAEAPSSSTTQTSSASKLDASKTKKDKLKKKKKSKGKKEKKSKRAKGGDETRPIPTPQQSAQVPTVPVTQAPPEPAMEPSNTLPTAQRPASVTQAAPAPAVESLGKDLTQHVEHLGDDQRVPPTDAVPKEPTSSTAPAACAKMAAKKAAPKKPGTNTVKVPVKTDSPAPNVPELNEAAMEKDVRQAQQVSSLMRSNTTSQYAPSPAPQATAAPTPTAEENKEGSDVDDEDEGEEEEDEFCTDIESDLEKETERENQPEQAKENGKEKDQQKGEGKDEKNEKGTDQKNEKDKDKEKGQQKVKTEPTDGKRRVRKKRREKTAVEKALHARYMKFSRSLKRNLSLKTHTAWYGLSVYMKSLR